MDTSLIDLCDSDDSDDDGSSKEDQEQQPSSQKTVAYAASSSGEEENSDAAEEEEVEAPSGKKVSSSSSSSSAPRKRASGGNFPPARKKVAAAAYSDSNDDSSDDSDDSDGSSLPPPVFSGGAVSRSEKTTIRRPSKKKGRLSADLETSDDNGDGDGSGDTSDDEAAERRVKTSGSGSDDGLSVSNGNRVTHHSEVQDGDDDGDDDGPSDDNLSVSENKKVSKVSAVRGGGGGDDDDSSDDGVIDLLNDESDSDDDHASPATAKAAVAKGSTDVAAGRKATPRIVAPKPSSPEKRRKFVTQSSADVARGGGASSSDSDHDSVDSLLALCTSGKAKKKKKPVRSEATTTASKSKPQVGRRKRPRPRPPTAQAEETSRAAAAAAKPSSSSAISLLSSDDDDSHDDNGEFDSVPLKSDRVSTPGASSDGKMPARRRSSTCSPGRSTSPLNDSLDFGDLDSPVFQPGVGGRRAVRTPRAGTAYARRSPGDADLMSPCFQPDVVARRRSSGESDDDGVAAASRRKVPTPVVPELMNELGGAKLYPEFRHEFIKVLCHTARKFRRASYQKGCFEAAVRAATILSLRPYPVRSADACKCIKGIGHELLEILKERAVACKDKPYFPAAKKYSSTAAAALVALLRHAEKNPEEPLCPMEKLITGINALVDASAGAKLTKDAAYYLDKNNLDPGWSQVKKLGAENSHAGMVPLIKERRKKTLCDSGVVFELLPAGRTVARRLEESAEVSPTPRGPLRQLAAEVVEHKYKDVTMSMDFREGGGGSKSLHKMCDLLDQHGVPYVVRSLKIADYIFFVGNKLAPILIERKTADDVANSLADGRWERQQRSMRKAQYLLGGGEARRCFICYIIEGDPSKRTVHGGNVGRASWDQSLEDVNKAIDELPKLGFSVMRSKSHMGTMVLLAKIASDISWRANNGARGSIEGSLRYDAFLRKMASLDDAKGKPPTSREHMFPAAPVEDGTTVTATNVPQFQDDDSDHDRDLDEGEEGEDSHDRREAEAELKKLSVGKLKEKCKDRDEKQGGKKAELIARLLKPRKPEILITLKRRGQYVPQVNSCNAALLVAMLLNDRSGNGLAKEDVMLHAEANGVSKEPMDAKNGYYDGWSGMSQMTSGDPALVYMKKKKFSLTRQPPGGAGYDVAQALHKVAHNEGICKCGDRSLS